MTFIEALMLWFMAVTGSQPHPDETVVKMPGGFEVVVSQREGTDEDDKEEDPGPVFEKINLGRRTTQKISNGL
ncbi:MAG: hypothetical protein H6737_03035 [Alphaproteobacteria bacterium]|nr:hypothetical protein [Alphaproteobacteria bacterium]